MQKKPILLAVITALFNLSLTGSGGANVPAPPVNQLLGIGDGIFNDLTEAECRACHDDPEVVSGPSNSDRHHLLLGTSIIQGACSVNKNSCLSDLDCDPGLCEFPPVSSCTVDADCPDGDTCGEICVGETAAPDLDANNDGITDTAYACLSCHQRSTEGGVIKFLVEKNCLACHVQVPGEASIHHLTATAQGTLPPEENSGDDSVGDCTPCHGALVDDIGDGHDIPTYDPTETTPQPSTRARVCSDTGDPCITNSDCSAPATCILVALPGGCNFCHDTGTGNPGVPGTDTESGTLVYGNNITHHSAGVHRSRTGGSNDNACEWCHPPGLHGNKMRVCEGCHGYESLHNIQADSNGDGVIEAGGESYGYGHIGIDDPAGESDCRGCHVNPVASAVIVAGPLTPYITATDVSRMTAGTDTPITLTGAAFTNAANGTEYTSNVVLTADDGTTMELLPDEVSESSLMVTIPGTALPGNHTLRAVKDAVAASNPVSISIKPAVEIAGIDCSKCTGTMTITGSGFSEKPAGSDEDLYVTEGDGGRLLKVISWRETEIKVTDARCRGKVNVNALFGSATISQ